MFDLELITEVDLISARRGLQQRLTALTDAVRRRQDAAERLWYYVYGEKAYLVLSLAAKSLLAWQIYFPSLD